MSNMHRTAMGKFLDLNALRIQQEKTIAVGNSKQNARGDVLGTGGRVVKSRDQVMTEFYSKQRSVPLGDSPIHQSTESSLAAATADIFVDNVTNGFDQVEESKLQPKVITSKTPVADTGGVFDAEKKSEELAKRLKAQRSRI